MTTLETLITQYGEACMESARNSGYDGADKHDSSVARMDAARAALVLAVDAALAARQAVEPVAWMRKGTEPHHGVMHNVYLTETTGPNWTPLYTHPSPQGQEGDAWKPISSAPKTGEVIRLAAFVDGVLEQTAEMQWSHIQRNGLFPGQVGMWVCPGGNFTWNPEPAEFGPTHWKRAAAAMAKEQQ